MPKKNRSILLTFLAAALALFAIYNLFGSALEHADIKTINPWFAAPFFLLLASIGVMPFILNQWWEKNYPLVAAALGLIVITYYVGVLNNTPRLFITLYDYICFISFIGSLYVVTGGIHIKMAGKANNE